MEEHELRLVEVNGEASEGEPGPDSVPGGGDFSDGGEVGGARGIDIAVVDVEGEVDVLPIIGGTEERGGGERGEDRGEGGALRSPLVDGEGFGGVTIV